MPDKVSLIRSHRKVIGFAVNGKEFYADETDSAEAQMTALKGFNISSIPRGIWLQPLDGDTLVFDGVISSTKKHPGIASMDIQTYRKYWDHKFGVWQYYNAMKEAINIRRNSSHDVRFIEMEDDGAYLVFRYNLFLRQDMLVNKALQRFQNMVQEIEGQTERILEKAEISPRVLKDEDRYTNEVLLPLFRHMGFMDVHYNHGKREFGKDVTFTEVDKFGQRRNYGVQVKVGDVSGQADSELDKIIAQIGDAFSVPYVETTS